MSRLRCGGTAGQWRSYRWRILQEHSVTLSRRRFSAVSAV